MLSDEERQNTSYCEATGSDCPDLAEARAQRDDYKALCARLAEALRDGRDLLPQTHPVWQVLNAALLSTASQAAEEWRAMKAELEHLRGGPPGPWPDCHDCGRAMVWDRDCGTWMCPRCVMRRCNEAERRVAELEACVMDRENDSAVCPEDRSVTETVTALRARVAELDALPETQRAKAAIRLGNDLAELVKVHYGFSNDVEPPSRYMTAHIRHANECGMLITEAFLADVQAAMARHEAAACPQAAGEGKEGEDAKAE